MRPENRTGLRLGGPQLATSLDAFGKSSEGMRKPVSVLEAWPHFVRPRRMKRFMQRTASLVWSLLRAYNLYDFIRDCIEDGL